MSVINVSHEGMYLAESKNEHGQVNNYIYMQQPNYHIQPNYCTYPYRRTVKQFRSLQVTAHVFVSTSL